jgi:hypothetical protein
MCENRCIIQHSVTKGRVMATTKQRGYYKISAECHERWHMHATWQGKQSPPNLCTIKIQAVKVLFLCVCVCVCVCVCARASVRVSACARNMFTCKHETVHVLVPYKTNKGLSKTFEWTSCNCRHSILMTTGYGTKRTKSHEAMTMHMIIYPYMDMELCNGNYFRALNTFK